MTQPTVGVICDVWCAAATKFVPMGVLKVGGMYSGLWVELQVLGGGPCCAAHGSVRRVDESAWSSEPLRQRVVRVRRSQPAGWISGIANSVARQQWVPRAGYWKSH